MHKIRSINNHVGRILITYGFFSVMIIFMTEEYRIEATVFCILVTLTASIAKSLSEKFNRWIYTAVFTFVSPAILFLVLGIRIWMIKFDFTIMLFGLLLAFFWGIYPLQIFFRKFSERIHGTITDNSTPTGKIVLSILVLSGVGGAAAGRLTSQTDFDIGFLVIGFGLVFTAFYWQFMVVFGSILEHKIKLKTSSKNKKLNIHETE